MVSLILSSRRGGNPLLPFLPGFRDTFDRPDSPLIATTDGRPWRRHQTAENSADILVRGNAAAVVVPEGATGNVLAEVQDRSPNGVLSAVVKTKGNQAAGVVFRSNGMSSMWELRLRANASDLRPTLHCTVNGTRTEVAQGLSGSQLADGDLLQIVLDGPNIIVYRNKRPIIAVESTANQQNAGMGLMGYTTAVGVTFDSLTYEA